MGQLMDTIFSLSNVIRYVAIYSHSALVMSSKPGTMGASSSESDKYEELIVNPAILTLVKQRGNIDCGGAEFVLIRYGNFFQFLLPIEGGHISVCIEPYADPLELLAPIRAALSQADLQLPGENA